MCVLRCVFFFSSCFVSMQNPQTLGVCAVGSGLYHRGQHWMRFVCLNKSLVSKGLRFYSHNGNCYRNAFHTEKRVSWIPSRRVLVLPHSVQMLTGTWIRKIRYVSFVLTQRETATMSDGKLVGNFSPESDVTSLQDSFTSRPYKTPF